ncbi:FG-GAP-like repeat-containing protein [Actinacidiphila bryophytorum]|uniref:FG-GAP-like repeat-containing protein n=1 Tax=Actinacidiphila bryophytorum TaxID=1436133 RepID=UPI002176CE60|nr:FG-GAP-like repeat-containing protein [Actinacidiphila bryophytorum]UWE07845.1 FG-GAP-like repeat-containing protein [Actinacidiphila bryophytorum]
MLTTALGALSLTTVAAPAHAAAPASAAKPTTTLTGEADASARAVASGQAVSVDSATSPTETETANPDGSFTLTQTAEPVRKYSGGAWKPLDATLVRNADGTVSPALTAGALTLSGGGTGPLAVMKNANRSLSLTLPATIGSLPAPALSGRTATYSEVLPGVDLTVTADNQGGFSETLVVKNATAAANPALATLTFATTAKNVTPATDAAGNFTAKDARGATVFAAPAPLMWDSATGSGGTAQSRSATPSGDAPTAGDPETSSSLAPGADAHVAPIKAVYRSGAIALTPDAALLTGDSTVYPLYIDPSYAAGGSAQGWTYTASAYAGTSFWNTTDEVGLRVGYQGWQTPYYTAHTFVRMSVSSKIYGAVIDPDKTHFYATETYAPSCTHQAVVQLWTTGAISSSTTWDNEPTWNTEIDEVGAAHGWSSDCPTASVGWDTHTAMQAIANHPASSITLGLRAADQDDPYGWKKFDHSTMTMTTTYNHKPAKPNPLTTSPSRNCTGGAMGNGDITLYAGVSDPDGGTVKATFTVTPDGASIPSKTVTAASGTKAVYTLTKANLDNWLGTDKATTVSWYVTASDGTYASDPSATCSFTFDPTHPGQPTVTDTASKGCNESAIPYQVGTPATFSVAPNTEGPPPNHYLYQLNGAAPLATKTATANLTIKPTRGTNILTVTSVSSGGNIGDTAVCVLYAAAAATAADGDLTGDGVPDLMMVGGQASLPAGLWLANGAPNGKIVTAPAQIGPQGTGVNSAGSPADWTGTQAITGHFASGGGFNDVLEYDPATGKGSVLYGDGDGSALTPNSGNQVTIASPTFEDNYNHLATSIANGGQLYNTLNEIDLNGYPDLLLIVNGILLDEPSNQFPGSFSSVDSALTLSSINPAGTGDWTGWTITSSLIGGMPALFARGPSGGPVYYYSPTEVLNLYPESAEPVALTLSASTALLQAAALNGDATPDLWQVNTNGAVTADLVDLSAVPPALLPQGAQAMAPPNHSWPLNDTAEGALTTAADTAGTLPATASGVTGTAGDLFSPAAHFGGAGVLTTSGPAVNTAADFTVSAWVRPAALGGYVMGQKGTHTSGFAVFSDPTTKSWRFEMPRSDATNPTEDVAAAVTVPAQVGTWVRLTGTFKASTGRMTLYIDDVAAAQAGHTTTWNASGPLTAGAYWYNDMTTGHFVGDIADVETYPIALTAKQVAILAGNPGPTSYAHINDNHDFTGDGTADVVAEWNDGTLHLYAGAAESDLVSEGQIWNNTWSSIRLMTSGNFTDSKDNAADVVAIWADGTAHLYTGDTDGNGDATGQITNAGQLYGGTGWSPAIQIAAADFTGDGHTDLLSIWSDGTVHIYAGDGNGHIAAPGPNIWNDASWKTMKLLGAGDYNNDGHADLLGEWGDGSLHLYTGDGNGHLTQGVQMFGGTTWSTVKGIVPGDFTNDGLTDLVAVWGDGTIHLYLGDGNSTLAAGPALWPNDTWKTMGLIA